MNFRREINIARKQFQDEWKSQQQMKMEGFNTQAAEEASLEREREERALKENEKELERMRIERCKRGHTLVIDKVLIVHITGKKRMFFWKGRKKKEDREVNKLDSRWKKSSPQKGPWMFEILRWVQ